MYVIKRMYVVNMIRAPDVARDIRVLPGLIFLDPLPLSTLSCNEFLLAEVFTEIGITTPALSVSDTAEPKCVPKSKMVIKLS